jgi:hypothetical protein
VACDLKEFDFAICSLVMQLADPFVPKIVVPLQMLDAVGDKDAVDVGLDGILTLGPHLETEKHTRDTAKKRNAILNFLSFL